MSTFITAFFVVLKVLAKEIRQEKEIKNTNVGGRKLSNLFLFTTDMMQYIENTNN